MQRAIDMGFVCSVCLSIFCEVSKHQSLATNFQDLALQSIVPKACLLHVFWHAWACAWQLNELWQVASLNCGHIGALKALLSQRLAVCAEHPGVQHMRDTFQQCPSHTSSQTQS